MDIDIVSVISSVGFPIFCCLALGYWVYVKDKQHKEEMEKMTDALNNNTLVLQKLVDKMENKND